MTAPKTEEKTAPTPGPWIANNKGIYPESDQPTEGEKPAVRSRLIALTQGPNARLIAAAPCMLEALRNLVMDWERVIGPIPEDHEAQVAIAKAEGGAA